MKNIIFTVLALLIALPSFANANDDRVCDQPVSIANAQLRLDRQVFGTVFQGANLQITAGATRTTICRYQSYYALVIVWTVNQVEKYELELFPTYEQK